MFIKNDRAVSKMLFSPIIIYFIIWGFILFLYSLKIVIFPELSEGFYIVMVMNVFGLIIGTFQAKLLFKKTNKSQILKNTENFFYWLVYNNYAIKCIYNVFIFLSVMGVLITYIKVFSQVSVTQFFFQQQFVKSNVVRTVFGTYLSMAAYIILPISTCLDYIAKKRIKYSVIPFALALMYSISYWGRFPLLMAVVILFACKMLFFILNKQRKDFLSYKKGTITKLIIYGVLMFLIVFLFMSWTIELRVSEYGDAYDPYANYYQENIITKSLKPISHLFGSFRAITLTYAYFVASIPTLSYWVAMESEYALGQASFPYIYRLLDKVGLVQEPLIVGDRALGRGMQLPSFIGYLYIDFGWIGVLIFSYIVGLMSTILYENFIRKPNIGTLMFLSLVYALIIFSPMTNIISQTMSVIILFGYFLINCIIKSGLKYRKCELTINCEQCRGDSNDGEV